MGIAVEHRAEQSGIGDGEDRGDSSHSRGGAENSQTNERGRFGQRADGVAQVCGDVEHVANSPKEFLDTGKAWHNLANVTQKGLLLTVAMVTAVVAITGCAHRKRNRMVVLPPAVTAPVEPGWTETGLASWYGHPYHGRPAADGEIYDMEKLTAAHRTLPFNTWVHVVNVTNHKAVDVRIIDRGPFVDGRVIDLSHAAARVIDLIGPGVAPVRIEVIRVAAAATAGGFAVQVGAFRDRGNAERVRSAMAARFGTARLVLREGNPAMWRVLVGSEPTEAGASVLSDRIRRESGEKTAFVVRLDS